jgi:hypothetical protein
MNFAFVHYQNDHMSSGYGSSIELDFDLSLNSYKLQKLSKYLLLTPIITQTQSPEIRIEISFNFRLKPST